MTRGANRAHIVRAALESIAYQTRELTEAMEADSGDALTELRVDGGAAANDFLMQFQADILGAPVARPAYLETTALGAAYLAGLAAGIWSGTDELERFPASRSDFRAGNGRRAQGRTLRRLESGRRQSALTARLRGQWIARPPARGDQPAAR